MSDQLFTDADNRGEAQGRELTGRTVLFLMVAFFTVIVGVNTFMVFQALSTFGGVETESSYRAGQAFERDVALANAQDARHWQVHAEVTAAPGGGTAVDVMALDAAGAPLVGLTATTLLARPTDRRLDRIVAMTELTPGRYKGHDAIAPGQWDLIIELARDGERVFRSKNRVVLH